MPCQFLVDSSLASQTVVQYPRKQSASINEPVFHDIEYFTIDKETQLHPARQDDLYVCT